MEYPVSGRVHLGVNSRKSAAEGRITILTSFKREGQVEASWDDHRHAKDALSDIEGRRPRGARCSENVGVR